MKTTIVSLAFAAGLLASAAGFAQTAPAGAPAGATGLCKDGTYYTGATKQGACRGHKGVGTWYGAATPAAAAPAAMAPAAAAAAPAAAATPGKKPAAFTPAATAAPGGGPGLVWVNTSSKVYHCQGDKWYGKTKAGSYMSEADAKTKGFHGPRGKTCGA
ncbi:MAG TPA: hypothetical protein VGC69_07125 [Bordetella sp.]